jgi:hypothetical protein
MKNDNYRSITFARFINLIEELSVLEDLLRYFENEEVTNIDRNRDVLEPIIIELIKWCAMYQQGIHMHLEECREWDAFPEAFWRKNNVQHITSSSERYPWDCKLSTKLDFVAKEIQRVARAAENCLRDYQYSGYIGHQPVAIDLLDELIEMCGQSNDMCNCLDEIIRKNIQLAIQ